ncbi:hypothetical protein C8R44DRAFT_878978 [Mycena epipterygia]|nr:hypothetical protein C8R44DRAFT_878978 [Mycena epipterygia]
MMDPGAYDDVDAEGELEQDGGGMTLVSAGGLATMGLAPPASALAAGGGVGKRYRPAPAKTFQCRGYGECRMVFSRSEHLARHIRKHTGERPFTCHCSKQFSRLDNLRQHAQTVHADKADLNEAMMRELTSLHATMTGGVPPPAVSPTSSTSPPNPTANANASPTNTNGNAAASTVNMEASATTKRPASKRAKASAGGGGGGGGGVAVKREPVDAPLAIVLERPRPGTSTGYEGAAGYMDVDEPARTPQQQPPSPPDATSGGAHSFRGDRAPFRPAHQEQRQHEPMDGARAEYQHREHQLDPRQRPEYAQEHGEQQLQQQQHREQQHYYPQPAFRPHTTNTHSGGSGQSFRGCVGVSYHFLSILFFLARRLFVPGALRVAGLPPLVLSFALLGVFSLHPRAPLVWAIRPMGVGVCRGLSRGTLCVGVGPAVDGDAALPRSHRRFLWVLVCAGALSLFARDCAQVLLVFLFLALHRSTTQEHFPHIALLRRLPLIFLSAAAYARRSPPSNTPSPPRVAGSSFPGGLASFPPGGRPFSSGHVDGFPGPGAFPGGAFPAGAGGAFPASFSSGSFSNGATNAFSSGTTGGAFPSVGAFFPPSSGSRPSTGSGARLPPLSAVVSSAAFRPSSGHGLTAPGASGSILLPNSLTLRRPSTGDWEWDAWSVRPGTAPGKLATAAAVAAAGDDSPFSFHPPEQPVGGGNPRKRAFGGPDGPHGAHTDDGGSGGGGYEYGSDSRPASRRLSVMELCNDDAEQQRPTSSSLGISLLRGGSAERERERERERPTTTNGLVSRASALVLHDHEHHEREREREHEPRQHAGEQHFAADRVAAAGHQAAQLQQALEQAQADAEMAAYQAQQAHFFHHQRAQERERRIEAERFHLQQQQQMQQQQAYLAGPYHPHPEAQHLEMGMGGMALGMEMLEGYPHQGHMLDLDSTGGAYLAHPPPHIEAPVDGGYPGDSPGYHTQQQQQQQHPHPHPHHHHHSAHSETLEQAHLEADSPASQYSLAYPPTPAAYPYETSPHSSAFTGGATAPGAGFATRPEDALRFEMDGDLGLLDMNMNMNMNMSMGIGLGVGGAAG